MSRSVHRTRKSAQRAFSQGDPEPTKEYSLKSDIKRWSKKARKVNVIVKKTLGSSRTTLRTGLVTTRNEVLVSALKKAKKPLNAKLDRKVRKP
jgi:hypothetical protein